jgi:hypothetical protein
VRGGTCQPAPGCRASWVAGLLLPNEGPGPPSEEPLCCALAKGSSRKCQTGGACALVPMRAALVILIAGCSGADVTGPISTSTLPVPSVAALSGHSRAESRWTTNPQDPGLHDQRDQR